MTGAATANEGDKKSYTYTVTDPDDANPTITTSCGTDGVKSNECNGGSQPAGWRGRDGRLWFPTIKGLVVLDPEQLEGLRLKARLGRGRVAQ